MFVIIIYSYSRKIIWLEVCPTNKDSKVVAGYYLRAVENFGNYLAVGNHYDFTSLGCPQIVRTDKGTENVKVAFLQPFIRHQSTGIHSDSNFIYGRSVSNQVN